VRWTNDRVLTNSQDFIENIFCSGICNIKFYKVGLGAGFGPPHEIRIKNIKILWVTLYKILKLDKQKSYPNS
jgi:hypothetical protein